MMRKKQCSKKVWTLIKLLKLIICCFEIKNFVHKWLRNQFKQRRNLCGGVESRTSFQSRQRGWWAAQHKIIYISPSYQSHVWNKEGSRQRITFSQNAGNNISHWKVCYSLSITFSLLSDNGRVGGGPLLPQILYSYDRHKTAMHATVSKDNRSHIHGHFYPATSNCIYSASLSLREECVEQKKRVWLCSVTVFVFINLLSKLTGTNILPITIITALTVTKFWLVYRVYLCSLARRRSQALFRPN